MDDFLLSPTGSSTPSPIRRFTRSPKKDAWRTGETQPMFNNRSPGRAGSVVEPCAEGAHPELCNNPRNAVLVITQF